jgi:hypothetical protein
MCALKNNFISSMAGNQKSLDIDTISVRNIFAKGTNNSILTANSALLTDGKGGTRWVDITAISTGLTFKTIATSLSTYTAGPGNTQFSILDSSTAGLVPSGSGNSVSIYAKAFGKIDVPGQDSIYSFEPVSGTINSNVQIVGSGIVGITTDTNLNKLQFYSPDTGMSSISTMVSNFVHLNGSLSNTILSFNSPFSTFIYNAISSFSTSLGPVVRYNELQSSISSFSSSLGPVVRYNELQSSISSFSSSLGPVVNLSQVLSTMSTISSARIVDINTAISSYSTLQGPLVTTLNFSSVLSTQNYIVQLKTGTLNTSTIQQQGLVQPAIQYGFSTLNASGSNVMTLSTNYINGNYAVQLSYTDTSSGTKPLSSSTITSSNFTVYGDNDAKIHWTTFGNLF